MKSPSEAQLAPIRVRESDIDRYLEVADEFLGELVTASAH
jgi:hypothetical protein